MNDDEIKKNLKEKKKRSRKTFCYSTVIRNIERSKTLVVLGESYPQLLQDLFKRCPPGRSRSRTFNGKYIIIFDG